MTTYETFYTELRINISGKRDGLKGFLDNGGFPDTYKTVRDARAQLEILNELMVVVNDCQEKIEKIEFPFK